MLRLAPRRPFRVYERFNARILVANAARVNDSYTMALAFIGEITNGSIVDSIQTGIRLGG